VVLFALCINPLLKILDKNLTGVLLGRSGPSKTAIAYADDDTIFGTKPAGFRVIREAVRRYKKEYGAHLMSGSSKL